MTNRILARLAVAVTVAAAPIGLRAQSAAAPLTFEVASVKPSAPGDPSKPITMVPMMVPMPGGAIRAQNIPLRLLIRAAYKVQDEQLAGGPSWQLSDKFDITAKPADGAGDGTATTEEALRARLQALLADRFKLKTHMETREMAVSALVVAKKDGTLGPNMRRSTADCSNQAADAQKLAEEIGKNPGNAMALMAQVKCGIVPMPQQVAGGPPQLMLKGMGQPIENLAALMTQFVGRTVVDKTGLTGNYDFEMEMPLDLEMLRRVAGQSGIALPVGGNLPQYDGPALTTILQDRLGLKLDSQKAPVSVLVIDSAEKPAAD